MFFGANSGWSVHPGRSVRRCVLLFLLALQAFPFTSWALPRRLVLGLDGVAYRDMKTLQEGVICTNIWGKRFRRQAFGPDEGYFPVSRLVSTFPSTSDVAWTDIFGDRPLPGYQRTYFSAAANSQIVINGITTTMEHESQMSWEMENNLLRTMGYVYPVHTFDHEIRETIRNFWNDTGNNGSYYVYIRATDDAQHLDRDIFAMLCRLDEQLQAMRTRYRAQEGRDLQILILSDHGHNHAGSFKRVEVRALLEKAGYRITESIQQPKDVVLPTTGIEDWVEIHNAPGATKTLMPLLTRLEGADLVTGQDPDHSNHFLVMNSRGERAGIDWNPTNNTYRYSTETGDPLGYRPVAEALARQNRFDADGFASRRHVDGGDPDQSLSAGAGTDCPRPHAGHPQSRHHSHQPEQRLRSLRLADAKRRGLVDVQQHPRRAGQPQLGRHCVEQFHAHTGHFQRPGGRTSLTIFPDLRHFRAEENGAELVTKQEESLTRIAHEPFDRDYQMLSSNEVYLRVWSPQLAHLDINAPVNVTIEKANHFPNPQNQHWVPRPAAALGRHLTLNQPVSFSDPPAYERVYALPSDLILKPQTEYRISGWMRGQTKSLSLFEFIFYTDRQGRPTAY